MSDLNKEELRKQYAELAKGLDSINNPKSPEEILMEQVVAGRGRNSAREKDRERFFRR